MQQSMTRCKDCDTYMLTTLLEQSHNMCRYCIKRHNELTSKNKEYIPIKDCESNVYTEWYKTTKLQPISDDEIELSQKPIPKSGDITTKGKNKFVDLYGLSLKDMVQEFASNNKTKDYVCYEIYKKYNFIPKRQSVVSAFPVRSLPYYSDRNEELRDLVYIDAIPNINNILNKSNDTLETYFNFIDYLKENKSFLKSNKDITHIEHITESHVNNLKQDICNKNDNKTSKNDILSALEAVVNENLTMEEIHKKVCSLLGRDVTKDYLYQLSNKYNLQYKKNSLKGKPKNNSIMTLNDAVKMAHGGNNNQTMDEICRKVNEIMGKECNKQSVYKSVNYFNLDYIRVKNLSRKPEEPTKDIKEIEECDVDEVLEAIPIQEPKEDAEVSVEQEVLTTIQDKARKLNCNTDKDYTTDTYIEVLEILKYIATKRTTLQRTRLDQKDITQGYQEDVLHEIEFSESEPGDTYLQDKLKLIRGYRRYFEHDYEDLLIMEDLLSTIDTTKLSEVLTKLKSKRNARDGKYFYIPRVDNSMIQKYEWAKNGQLDSRIVNKPLLTTAAKLESRKMHQYVATCQVSGYGIGTFKDWKRIVTAPDEKNAEEQVLKVLNNTKTQKCGNYMWHNLNIKLQS